MEYQIFQVDAFTSKKFGGNPAAIVPLLEWLPDETLLAIAAENNLSDTAYFVPKPDGTFHLRWFTPEVEVNLCGHATLATAHVLFEHLNTAHSELAFDTRSGRLTVQKLDNRLMMDFPADPIRAIPIPEALSESLGQMPLACFQGTNYMMAVLRHEADVQALRPDFVKLAQVEAFGLVVTAPSEQADFVSRFFAPRAGINEDPVTGSAHCLLVPYWAELLGKTAFYAKQISARGGELWCTLAGPRVKIAGEAVTYMRGVISV